MSGNGHSAEDANAWYEEGAAAFRAEVADGWKGTDPFVKVPYKESEEAWLWWMRGWSYEHRTGLILEMNRWAMGGMQFKENP